METSLSERGQIKKELIVFLVITFGATYLFEFLMYGVAGPYTEASTKIWNPSLPATMFLPALSAILCMVYFKSRALTKEALVIVGCFLLCVIAYILGFLYSFNGLLYAGPVGIVALVVLHAKKQWREGLSGAKLSFGKNFRYYLLIPLVLGGLFCLSYLLNYWTGFGAPQNGFSPYRFLMALFPALLIGFVFDWSSYFGEEFGWRGYLQDRLFPLMGGYWGVLVLGIIWGLWHSPIIVFGYNYPGQPVMGNVLMIAFTIVMGIIFSYAVLKTGSIWIAVLLHMVVDTIDPLATSFITSTTEPILSFGTGFYGIALIAIFSLILLRSPVWRTGIAILPK